MAKFEVKIHELVNVRDHPHGDVLSLANIDSPDGYQVIVKRGQFADGDLVVYVPEGAVVPEPILDELGLVGALSGKKKNVVKAVRLRSEISQGLVWRPRLFDPVDLDGYFSTGQDLAEELGITKHIPEIPVHMAGDHEAAPDLLDWVEIENIKKFPKAFTEGEPVTITEKLHGTCVIFCLQVATGEFQVASKGIASEGLALKYDKDNLYWRVADLYAIKELLQEEAEVVGGCDQVALYGEVFGLGVQDLTYGETARGERPGFAAFDLRFKSGARDLWFPVTHLQGRVPLAPVLYQGPFSRSIVGQFTDGPETFSGQGLHLREGVVVRPLNERFDAKVGGRLILKSVSEAYLLRKKGDRGLVGEPTELN